MCNIPNHCWGLVFSLLNFFFQRILNTIGLCQHFHVDIVHHILFNVLLSLSQVYHRENGQGGNVGSIAVISSSSVNRDLLKITPLVKISSSVQSFLLNWRRKFARLNYPIKLQRVISTSLTALIGNGLISVTWCKTKQQLGFFIHFSKIHRSALRKITIDLLYFWDVYDVNLWEKNFGRSTAYSCRTNIFI